MDVLIKNATVVTGDGKTVLESAAVLIEGGLIRAVEARWDSSRAVDAREVIDATGQVVVPGIINPHTHGVTPGPLFPSGTKPLPIERVLANLDRHLTEGTTTVLNLCGFAAPEDVAAVKDHSVNVKTATSHTPLNLEAALAADGSGISPHQRSLTVEQMLEEGAVAIGEIGAGHTLGGGGQDYMYIPAAIKRETGMQLTAMDCRDLKYAVLGRHVRVEEFDEAAVERVLTRVGLSERLSIHRAREIIQECVLPSFHIALRGFDEAAALALKYKVPAVFHNSAPSKQAMLEIAEKYSTKGAVLVAGHCNHDTFVRPEALEASGRLKAMGAVIELSTLDGFIRHRLVETPENWDALVGAGLADVFATDYAGGDHDPIIVGMQHLLDQKIATLPQVVAMATANVARAIPGLAPNRGVISRGKVADLVLSDRDNLAKIHRVMVSGRTAVREGVVENRSIPKV